jgi:hypothetical protein
MLDNKRFSALHVAVSRGHTKAVTMMLASDRVDVNLRATHDLSCLDLATTEEMRQLLVNSGRLNLD